MKAKVIAVAVLGALSGAAFAAQQLSLTGPGSFTIRNLDTGELRTCTVASLSVAATFNSIYNVTGVTNVNANVNNCTTAGGGSPPTIPPVVVVTTPTTTPGANAAFRSKTFSATSSLGKTPITVDRVGTNVAGALNVVWKAESSVYSTPMTGTLSWPAADSKPKYITLPFPRVNAQTTIKLTLPGDSATLTLLP